MKRYIFILVTMLFALYANAQIKQEVIASAGGYNVNGGLSISWTLGETIIPTFKSQDGSLILTHGFQQQLIITTVEENLEVLVKIKIFPNPASDVVNIQFESPVDGEVVLTIYDSQGKLVKRDMIESTMVEKQINLQDIPAGIYYLKLTKGKLVNVYKVVKL
jgi:Secretion system C-terminal sorting domain